MSSSCTFSQLKLMEVTSNRESLYMKTSSQIPDLTSRPSTLTAKKSMKTTFSSDKIYYNFLVIYTLIDEAINGLHSK